MMKRRARRWAGWAIVAGMAGAGCGDGTPPVDSSMVEAKVSGKVTYKGKPVNKAEIIFNAANIARKDVASVVAPLKEDGSYEISTLVGENMISFNGPGVARNPELTYAGSSLDVQPGENKHDITLP